MGTQPSSTPSSLVHSGTLRMPMVSLGRGPAMLWPPYGWTPLRSRAWNSGPAQVWRQALSRPEHGPEVPAAVKCRACGKPAQPNHRFCGDCGKVLPRPPVTERIECTDCGAEVDDENSRFCTSCGAKFED